MIALKKLLKISGLIIFFLLFTALSSETLANSYPTVKDQKVAILGDSITGDDGHFWQLKVLRPDHLRNDCRDEDELHPRYKGQRIFEKRIVESENNY